MNFIYRSKDLGSVSVRTQWGRYDNDNIALELIYDGGNATDYFPGELILKASVNPHQAVISLPQDRVCLKEWDENADIADQLYQAGVIEREPLHAYQCGFVIARTYKLTPAALAEIEQQKRTDAMES